MDRVVLKVLGVASIVLASLAVTTSASAATFYLRPNTVELNKSWSVVGASTLWEAVDESVTEMETPSSADYIQSTSSKGNTVLGLATTSILGVGVKASLWYYTATAGTLEAKSTVDAGWQTTTSVGWHSINETILSQAALDSLGAQFRTPSSSTVQVRAAFLKMETTGPHIYWGAWMDGDVYKATDPGLGDAPWDSTTWNLFEAHARKPVSIVHFGQPPPWEQSFAVEPLELTRKRGAYPLMDMGNGYIPGKAHTDKEPDNRVSLKEINEGKYDSYFKNWAEAAAAYGYPFFFRWDWEMNGTWYKWGEDAKAKPSEFREAWIRLHKIAVEKKATNVTWVWCPNVQFSGSTSLAELYPGNEYVDWTCLDGYNKTGFQFESIIGPSYTALTTAIAPSKPVMIGETSTSFENPSKRESWMRNALRSLPVTFPKIEAFLWFNWNIVQEGHEWEWPIEWEGAEGAFAEEINSPFFAANEFGEPTTLKAIQPLP
jgi:hypothetical protein